jgi:phospholipid/cholesterol/gamma-HCH transport system permease protein
MSIARSAPLIERAFEVRRCPRGEESADVELCGTLTFADAGTLWSELQNFAEQPARGGSLNFRMSALDAIDGSSMALLVYVRALLHQRGVRCELLDASPEVQKLIHLYGGDIRVGRRKKRRAERTLAQVGRGTLEVLYEAQLVLGFFGQMLVAALGVLRAPRTANWRELPPTMERTGADAVPIVILINFLVGLVMAFQGAIQLKQFGANIFVADLVGLSVTRELGPLMTAIIVCGRSGAAFAAELGSMKVNEEIDALRSMGIGPLRYLVLPRLLGVTLVMPLLVLIADAVGMLGGLVVGVFSLDLSPLAYLRETQDAVVAWDVFSGLIKSVFFAIAIALIACQQGLATSGGAEGVGRRTTASVVSILFALIMIDALFTLLFHAAGL